MKDSRGLDLIEDFYLLKSFRLIYEWTRAEAKFDN